MLLQTGSIGQAPVPPEKRFLINFTRWCRIAREEAERAEARP